MKETTFRDHIDRLKTACHGQDIAAMTGLQGRGKRFFCPECQPQGGKTPDLDVFDEGFKCYKCGKTGDVIDLVVLAGGMSKASAIEYLEQLSGIKRPTKRQKGSGQPSSGVEIVRPTRSDTVKNGNKSAKQTELIAAVTLEIYEVFLKTVCGPIYATPGAEYLAGRGIDAETADHCGVRYCKDLARLWTLTDRGTIKAAGLSSLYVYQKAGLPFLAFPYIRKGKPVFIKTRCLLSKEEADSRQVPRFLNTAGRVPCLWNHDVIDGSGRILICEGEIDALTAVQAGEVGVGLPGWGHFKDAWIMDFRGKDVVLVLDADEAGRKGTLDIASRFIQEGLPAPRQLVLDKGKDLNEYYLSIREYKE